MGYEKPFVAGLRLFSINRSRPEAGGRLAPKRPLMWRKFLPHLTFSIWPFRLGRRLENGLDDSFNASKQICNLIRGGLRRFGVVANISDICKMLNESPLRNVDYVSRLQ